MRPRRSTEQRVVITVDTENTDFTHAAWWVVIDPERQGASAVVGGPFFSRAEAQEFVTDSRREFEVWALPGKGQYRVRLEEIMRDPSAGVGVAVEGSQR